MDFCDIVGNAGVTGKAHERQWLRNVFTDPMGVLEECNAPDQLEEPWVAEGGMCVPFDDGPKSEGSGLVSGGTANAMAVIGFIAAFANVAL